MKQFNEKQKAAYVVLLAPARHYLENTPGARLCDAAKTVHLSQFHFHRIFTQTFGKSPKAMTTELQVNLAKALLGNPDISLPDIAAKCGFSHIAHFCSRFKAVTGQSPGRHRKQLESAASRAA